jgi:hypothetical protein
VLDGMGNAVVRSIRYDSSGNCCTVTFPQKQDCDDFLEDVHCNSMDIDYAVPVPRRNIRGNTSGNKVMQVEKAWCSVKRIPQKKKISFGDGDAPSNATRTVKICSSESTIAKLCVHAFYRLLESGSRGPWTKMRSIPMRIKRMGYGWCIELTSINDAHQLMDHIQRFGEIFKTSILSYTPQLPVMVSYF